MMALATFAGNLEVTVKASATRAAGAIDQPQTSLDFKDRRVFKFGNSGSMRASQVFQESRSLAGGASHVYSLNGTGGGGNNITNEFGETIVFTSISLLYLKASGTQTISMGSSLTSDPWGPWVTTPAGDRINITAGATKVMVNPGTEWVVNATNDNLRIANLGGSASAYEIILIGRMS